MDSKLNIQNSILPDSIPFTKMSGSGNDFILIDNRGGRVTEAASPAFVTAVCRRKLSAGADGVIFIENSQGADFKWRFYNSDGSLAEMCGNGARCAARFAWLQGIAGRRSTFETTAGIISAQVVGRRVKVGLTDPSDIVMNLSVENGGEGFRLDSVNTGVPHAVMICEGLENIDVTAVGRRIRYHEAFAPAGTNVNFVALQPDGSLAIRTYERGVEDETLACGTGAVAAALVAALRKKAASPVTVIPRGGAPLTVYFRQDGKKFREAFLEGDARVIYEGRMKVEAMGV